MREEQDIYGWLEEKHSPRTTAWTREQNERTGAYFAERWGGRYQERVQLGVREHFPVVQSEGERCFVICEREDGTSTAQLCTRELRLIRSIGTRLQERLGARIVDILPSAGGGQALLTMLEPDEAFYTVAVLELEKDRLQGSLLRNVVCAIWDPQIPGRVLYTTYPPQGGEPKGLLMGYYPEEDRRELILETDGPAVSTLPVATGGGLYWKVKRNFQTDQVYAMEPAGTALLTGGVQASFKPLGTRKGRHYLLTNAGAPGYRVVSCAPGEGAESWITIIPESRGQVKDCVLLADRLLLIRMEDACCFLEAYDIQGRHLETLGSREDCYNLSFGDSPMSAGCLSFDEDRQIYLQREGFLQEPQVLLYDVRTGLKQVEEGDCLLPEGWETKQYFIPSDGGVRVPIFVTRDRNNNKAGQPALVFSYGGYALPVLPHSANSTTGIHVRDWVRAGGIYVSCCLRGGSEYGEPWHEAGMLDRKKQVFSDLHAVLLWLKESGELPVGKVAVCGQSNGGLTVTATLAAWPEAMDCAVASVAHTDMLAFVRDARGPIYTREYGDPGDPEMRAYLLSYSPYHNIKPGRSYPPVYLQVGECDNNVPAYHSKKLTARLEENPENRVLLRCLPHGGHDRGSGEERRLAFAEMRLFLEEQLDFHGLTGGTGTEINEQKMGLERL